MSYQLTYAPLAPRVWQKLAEIERTGWVMRGIQNSETVQDHTIALIELAQAPEFSAARADGLCEILEVHDWPEAIVGDEVILVWDDDAEKERRKAEKHQREQVAMQSICTELGEVGPTIYALWERYEAGADPTAKFAKELDKYQAIEQALTYEFAQLVPGLFKEFRDYLLPVFTHPSIIARLSELEKLATSKGVEF
jgi:putative hydrolase of HD superfamily